MRVLICHILLIVFIVLVTFITSTHDIKEKFLSNDLLTQGYMYVGYLFNMQDGAVDDINKSWRLYAKQNFQWDDQVGFVPTGLDMYIENVNVDYNETIHLDPVNVVGYDNIKTIMDFPNTLTFVHPALSRSPYSVVNVSGYYLNTYLESIRNLQRWWENVVKIYIA